LSTHTPAFARKCYGGSTTRLPGIHQSQALSSSDVLHPFCCAGGWCAANPAPAAPATLSTTRDAPPALPPFGWINPIRSRANRSTRPSCAELDLIPTGHQGERSGFRRADPRFSSTRSSLDRLQCLEPVTVSKNHVRGRRNHRLEVLPGTPPATDPARRGHRRDKTTEATNLPLSYADEFSWRIDWSLQFASGVICLGPAFPVA